MNEENPQGKKAIKDVGEAVLKAFKSLMKKSLVPFLSTYGFLIAIFTVLIGSIVLIALSLIFWWEDFDVNNSGNGNGNANINEDNISEIIEVDWNDVYNGVYYVDVTDDSLDSIISDKKFSGNYSNTKGNYEYIIYDIEPSKVDGDALSLKTFNIVLYNDENLFNYYPTVTVNSYFYADDKKIGMDTSSIQYFQKGENNFEGLVKALAETEHFYFVMEILVNEEVTENVLDSNGNIVYKQENGEYILDGNGNKIPETTTKKVTQSYGINHQWHTANPNCDMYVIDTK